MRRLLWLLEAHAMPDDPHTIERAVEIVWQNSDSDDEEIDYAVAEILGRDYDPNNGWGDDPPDDATFRQAFNELAVDRIERVIDQINRRFKGNELAVWREITAPEDWRPTDDRHLGIYWSWDKNAAEAHWAGEGVRWLLAGSVTAQAIDWVATLAANADLTIGEDEKEVRLHDNAPVRLLRYDRV